MKIEYFDTNVIHNINSRRIFVLVCSRSRSLGKFGSGSSLFCVYLLLPSRTDLCWGSIYTWDSLCLLLRLNWFVTEIYFFYWDKCNGAWLYVYIFIFFTWLEPLHQIKFDHNDSQYEWFSFSRKNFIQFSIFAVKIFQKLYYNFWHTHFCATLTKMW